MNPRQTVDRGLRSAALSYPELDEAERDATLEPFRKEAGARLAAGLLSNRAARRLVDDARRALAKRYRELATERTSPAEVQESACAMEGAAARDGSGFGEAGEPSRSGLSDSNEGA